MSRQIIVIGAGFALALAGLSACSGGSSGSGGSGVGPPPVSPPVTPPAADPVSISGVVTFDRVPFAANGGGLDYDAITQDPVRSVRVELLDASGQVLGADVTDTNGAYQFDNITANTDVQVRVNAKMVPESGTNYDVVILDDSNNNTPYALVGTLTSSGAANSTRDLNAGIGDLIDNTEPRPSGPFAILDTMYNTIETVRNVDANVSFPLLEVSWSVSNSEGTFFQPGGGTSTNSMNFLGREGVDPDEYDEGVVVHEFAHFLQEILSRDDSLGGSHTSDAAHDMRVSFSEGFANALAGIVLEDGTYRDASGARQANAGVLVLESNDFSPKGFFDEGTTGSAIYDIFDPVDVAGDENDNLALGFGPIYRALTSDTFKSGAYFTTIFSFAEALGEQPDVTSADVATLMGARLINSVVANGAGETNSAGLATALPIYQQMTLGGASNRFCSTNQFGQFNFLGNYSFGEFTTSSAGNVSIDIQFASGNNTAAPTLQLFKDGQETGRVGGNSGTSSASSSLAVGVGTHVFTVSTQNNIDNSETGTDVCYDITIGAVN